MAYSQAAAYEYEVLPGLQPGVTLGLASMFRPRDLSLSCGWHTNDGCYGWQVDGEGIDLVMPAGGTALQPVYAVFRARTRHSGLTARVSDVVLANVCKKVKIEVLDASSKRVAYLWYTHILPSVDAGNAINLPVGDSGLDALAVSPLGVVAWHRGGHPGGNKSLEDACGASTGPHLHQWGDYVNVPAMHANRAEFTATTATGMAREAAGDVDLATGTLTGNGFPRGFHPNPGKVRTNPLLTAAQRRTPLRAYPVACSDTWVFKFRSSKATPGAEAVAPCPTIAAPTSLKAVPGERLLALRWTAPVLPQTTPPAYTIAGYEIRHKLTSASVWPKTWTPASGTSHTLTGLLNGTPYDVQVRALSDRHLRSAAIADSGTPTTSPPPGETCTVSVSIQDAGGKPLSVSGVGVTGGGTGACGDRQLAVALTNANYLFTGWSASACGGTTAPTTCTVATSADSGPLKVTATFTRKHCTVTGNIRTLDTSGVAVSTAGGTVRANGTTRASATVPCGKPVTLAANANAGYSFLRWSLGPCKDAGNPCTVTTSGLSGGPPKKPGTVSTTATFQKHPPLPPVRCTVTGRSSDTTLGTVVGGKEVNCGKPVTLTATEKTNGQHVGWSAAGCSGLTCKVKTSAANRSRTVTATFTPKRCTVTGQSNDNALGTVSGSDTVDCGKPVPLTARPADVNHEVQSWSGGGCSGKGTRCTVRTSGDNQTVKVSVTFGTKSCTVSGAPASGHAGRGRVDGSAKVTCGGTVTLTATSAGPPWRFLNWRGCPAGGASGDSCAAKTSGARPSLSVTAAFAKRYCHIATKTQGTGNAWGDASVQCGVGSVTLKARAGTGYCFTGWSATFGRSAAQRQGSTCRATGSITVAKPTLDYTYTAHFKRRPPTTYRLTVTGGSGSDAYPANTYATASAPAGKCVLGITYTFKRWTGDSSSTSRTIRLYMNRNKSVTATFTISGACSLAQGDGDGNPDDTPAKP